MTSHLKKLDPAWAWSPFEPSVERPWDRAAAAHLYRRAGFMANAEELDRAVRLSPAAAIERLMQGGAGAADFAAEADQMAAAAANGNPRDLAAGWLLRMTRTPQPLLEKLTLFWHGHFACSAAKVLEARMMIEQNMLFRRRASGPFEPLVQEIARDPAMLVYLDSATNRKARPNENFARELMELFCLGVNRYTEHDVQELARSFTGWEVNRQMFRFNPDQHDFGMKAILGQRGTFDGGEAISIILRQPAAASFIAGKLVRFFVTDDPELPDEMVEPIARELRQHDFTTAPAVKKILGSQLFFSEHAVGRKIRSPVEMSVGLLRALAGSTNFYQLADWTGEIGQALYYPPSVKGWDGGRSWINSSTLVGRANLVRRLVDHPQTRFGGGNLVAWAERHGLTKPEQIVDAIIELLFAVQPPAEVRARWIGVVAAGKSDRSRQIGDVLHAMSTLPEFQLN